VREYEKQVLLCIKVFADSVSVGNSAFAHSDAFCNDSSTERKGYIFGGAIHPDVEKLADYHTFGNRYIRGGFLCTRFCNQPFSH
jgi:hypothetical protein